MDSAQKNFTRLPPHSEDAEQSLLGAVLLDGDVLTGIMPLLAAEDFYATAHQRIYSACTRLFNEGRRVDAIMIKDELARTGDLEKVGGEEYLTRLVALVPSAAGAADYARIVSEKAVRRNLIHACTGIQSSAYEGGVPGPELLDFAESQILGIGRGAADQETVGIQTVLNETFDEIQALIDGGAQSGTPTGFFEFDDMTAGLGRGDLVLVAGRPSMGKTTFSNCIVDQVGVVERQPVLYFSIEVNRRHLVRNMLCARSRVPLQKVRRGNLDNSEIEKLTHAADDLMEAPIYIDDSSQQSAMSMRAKARRLRQKLGGLGLVVIDYLQLMETGRAENRQQEIAQISRALKGMAREMECPVIANSQLNRSVDSREDRVPRMSDLRESGALEQDADLICFLYREFQYKPTEENKHKAEVIVAKQRNGPTGRIPLHFQGEILRFDNVSFQTEEGF